MQKREISKSIVAGGVVACAVTSAAIAASFNIPSGDLATALDAYTAQTGVELVISESALAGARTHGAVGQYSSDAALKQLLKGTGFTAHQESGAIAVVPDRQQSSENLVEQNFV